MSEQWPSERNSERQWETISCSSGERAKDFVETLALLSHDGFEKLDLIAKQVIEQDGDFSDLEKLSNEFHNNLIPSIQDGHLVLMALACAAAIAQAPSLNTWKKIKEFQCNSWHIENWLSGAMIAYAKIHDFARKNYIDIARKVFYELESFSSGYFSSRANANKERLDFWNAWIKNQGKLEEIWWGLRGWHALKNHEDEFPLFQAFYVLAPDEFISTISESSNPYLVADLLFAMGIGAYSSQFSAWKRAVAVAPPAFNNRGEWNGSVLVPLLLVEARNQMLQVGMSLQNMSLSPKKTDEIKEAVARTAEIIVTALAGREDASGIFVRWSSWLFRNILGRSEREITDVKSSAFSDDALIDALGRHLNGRVLPEKAPGDAALWENWCYRCALVSFAYNGQAQAPDCGEFTDEWRLSPEDWIGEKGRNLRGYANLMTILNKDVPGIAANLLAYPIARSSSPGKVWVDLWNNATVLREIIEFGDSDAIEEDYKSSLDAGGLVFLLFCIGLAVFDQVAARIHDENSNDARAIVSLFEGLTSAVDEMREIDSTLSHDKWLSAMQHLAVRRIIWEPSLDNEDSLKNPRIFRETDSPTVHEILTKETGDVINMVSVLQSLLLNVSEKTLKNTLAAASINVSDIVQSIRRLNRCHPRKYPINKSQIEKLEEII